MWEDHTRTDEANTGNTEDTEDIDDCTLLIEFLNSEKSEIFYGIFTLIFIEAQSKRQVHRYGPLFRWVVCLIAILLVAAQLILPILLNKFLLQSKSAFCTLPGEKDGGTLEQRLVMTGVSAIYVNQMTMRTFNQYEAVQLKKTKMRSILKKNSTLNLVFNFDASWRQIYIGVQYIGNLMMIFFLPKETLLDMIFNAVAMEYILEADKNFVANFTATFGIDNEIVMKSNQRPAGKFLTKFSAFLEFACHKVAFIIPLIALLFAVYGPICKPANHDK